MDSITYRKPSGELIRSLGYEYDAVGMITNIVTSDDGSQLFVKSYQYDSLNRLTSETRITDNGSQTTEYTYDLAGNRLRKSITDNQCPITVNYAAGVGNRLDGWGAALPSGTDNLRRRTIAGTSSETRCPARKEGAGKAFESVV